VGAVVQGVWSDGFVCKYLCSVGCDVGVYTRVYYYAIIFVFIFDGFLSVRSTLRCIFLNLPATTTTTASAASIVHDVDAFW
jgi:hypothetical protein